MRTRVFASLAILMLSGLALQAADLSVSKVVLYKHGIGFFERSGNVPPGDSAQLQFKATEMDDVLKSLTVEQRGGEGVSAIRYDSSDPLSKRLEVFPFRIGQAITLSQILDQFKGAEVELRLSSGKTRGSIVSARTIPASERQPQRQELMLLTKGELQTVDPAAAAGLRFVDPKLQSQFADYLGVVARSRNLEKRTVTIESSGEASEVAASYVVPTPIWKSSYRLVFDAKEKPLLEGWAIVDNTSGEDWTNVRLSLVSGLPVSFISRLYEPRYLSRPVVQLAQDRAWRPVIHGGAVEDLSESKNIEMALAPPSPATKAGAYYDQQKGRRDNLERNRSFRQQVAGGLGGGVGRGVVGGLVGSDERFQRQAVASTVAATAVGAELGELFEYKIDRPVNIRKGESAMLPFFRERVEARRLLIYDHSNASQHPLNAVELTNSGDTTMDGGAITVYDVGAYAGEALMETVKSGDKRLISYAVDLGTRITPAFDSESKLLSEFHYQRGLLTTKTARRETKTFTIRNVDSKSKTVIIEHAVRPEYKLIDMKPEEKTANSYRFEVKVDPGATKKFPVVEERVYSQQIAVTNMTPDQIFAYVRNEKLDEAGRKKLEEIADLKRQIADTDRELGRVNEQINNLGQDQSRLRSNISTLRSVAGQQQRVMEYADKLSAQEGKLVSLRDQQNELRLQKDKLQKELNTLMETLKF